MTLRELKSDERDRTAQLVLDINAALNGEFSAVKATKIAEAALTRRAQEAREAAFNEAELAFMEAYSDYDDPLLGVMYGLKAICARHDGGEK
jgi:hypothetical protein